MSYIDREKIREAIKNYGKGAIADGKKTLDVVDDIVYISALVDYVPAEDVAPIKHGKWMLGRFNSLNGNYEEQCSNCKEFSTEYSKPYCPNCGADMREDLESGEGR